MSFSNTSIDELIERKARYLGTTFKNKVVRIYILQDKIIIYTLEIDLDMLLRHRVNRTRLILY